MSHQVENFSGGDTDLSDVSDALIAGEIDAMFAMGGPETPVIKDLLAKDNLDVMSFDRADAYQAKNPGVVKLLVPEGLFDLAGNIPNEDLILLSATTNLVTLDSLYPGVTPLFLSSMATIRGTNRFYSGGQEFPNAESVSRLSNS